MNSLKMNTNLSSELYYQHLFREELSGYIEVNKQFKDYKYANKYDELLSIANELEGEEDIFITLNTTFNAKRRIENLRQLRCLYIDIDFDNKDKSDCEVRQIIYEIYNRYLDSIIPFPTIINRSGGGLHLYWIIDNAPKQALYIWQELEDYLYHKLKDLGADKKATDCIRLLRLPSTINSKYNKECKVIFVDENYKYTLYELAEDYLRKISKSKYAPRKKTTKKEQTKIIKNRLYSSYSLHYNRMLDLEQLLELRNYDIKGERNSFLHCYAYWRGLYVRDKEQLSLDVHAFNNKFKEPEKHSVVNSVIRSTGKMVDKFINFEQELNSGAIKRVSKNMRDKPGYWYKNDTLIELFKISEIEQQQLRTIIGTREKYNRNNKRRRESRRDNNGLLKREKELINTIENIKELKNKGYTQKECAKKINLSISTVKRYWNK